MHSAPASMGAADVPGLTCPVTTPAQLKSFSHPSRQILDGFEGSSSSPHYMQSAAVLLLLRLVLEQSSESGNDFNRSQTAFVFHLGVEEPQPTWYLQLSAVRVGCLSNPA